VDALAGRDHGGRGGVGHAANLVGKDAGGVDHYLCGEVEALAGFAVDGDRSVDEVVCVFPKRNDREVVQDGCAVVGGGLHQVDEQARVVELAVVVNDSALQAVGLQRGQALEG